MAIIIIYWWKQSAGDENHQNKSPIQNHTKNPIGIFKSTLAMDLHVSYRTTQINSWWRSTCQKLIRTVVGDAVIRVFHSILIMIRRSTCRRNSAACTKTHDPIACMRWASHSWFRNICSWRPATISWAIVWARWQTNWTAEMVAMYWSGSRIAYLSYQLKIWVSFFFFFELFYLEY